MGDEVATQQDLTAQPANVDSGTTQEAANEQDTASAPVEPSKSANVDEQNTDNQGSDPGDSTETGQEESKQTRELKSQRKQRQLLEQENAFLKSQIQAQPKPENGAGEKADGMPRLEDFDDYDKFEEARLDRIADQKVKKLFNDQKVEQKKQTVETAYQDRMKEAVAKNPGLSQKISSVELPEGIVTAMQNNGTIQEIKESAVGPEIAGYLADNPDQAYEFAKMDNRQAIREITKLEARLSTPTQQPQTNKISQTPPPIVPNSGRGTSPKRVDEMSTSEFIAYRNKKEYG
ncbi:MAG: hypothetical protein GY928_20580 [Colwellia sp.]|nr:hypothetical protein [Colwellia sp.]